MINNLSFIEQVLFVGSFVVIIVSSIIFIGEYIKDIYYFIADRKKNK